MLSQSVAYRTFTYVRQGTFATYITCTVQMQTNTKSRLKLDLGRLCIVTHVRHARLFAHAAALAL